MDSQAYQNFFTSLKSTLLCRSNLPLEFYYKIDHQDYDQYDDTIYSPLYSVVEYMGCFFKGFFWKSDSENLMIGLEMSMQEVKQIAFNVHWFVSIYDATEDTFFCLGKSKFDVDNVKYCRDKVYVSFKTINNFIKNNQLLLKWTVNILTTESKKINASKCAIREDSQGKIHINSSLDSLFDIVSSETHAIGESKNKEILQIMKEEIDGCRRQQNLNEKELQDISNQFHEIDFRLANHLDRVSLQLPKRSLPLNLPFDRGIKNNVGILHENCKRGRIHMNNIEQLRRAKSEPLLCERSFDFSNKDQVFSLWNLKLALTGGSQIADPATDSVRLKDKYTQTEKDVQPAPHTSANTRKSNKTKDNTIISRPMLHIGDRHTYFKSKPSFYERKVVKDFMDDDDPWKTEKIDLVANAMLTSCVTQSLLSGKNESSYKHFLFIGNDLYLMQEIMTSVFHKDIHDLKLYNDKLSKIAYDHLRVYFHLGFIHHQTLESWLSEVTVLNQIQFHGCVVVLGHESIDLLGDFNEDFLRQYCIIIRYHSTYSFQRRVFKEIVWKSQSSMDVFPYRSKYRRRHYSAGDEICDTIRLLSQAKPFQIEEIMLPKQLKVPDLKVLSQIKVMDKKVFFKKIQEDVIRGKRMEMLTDYMITLLQEHRLIDGFEATVMRNIIEEDTAFFKITKL